MGTKTENRTRATTTTRSVAKMKVTMTAMTGNKVKEMIGDGRGEMYKDRGAGLGVW